MTYFAPYIDNTGPHIPLMGDIFQYMTDSYSTIFGPDIYLGNDSQDLQMAGIFSRVVNDTNQLALACYYSRSPTSAVGAALSGAVKINGLTRGIPTYSSALLTIVGQAGATLSGCAARDTAGNLWALDANVTIPLSGTIDQSATCQTIGAINAQPNSVNIIATPTQGWQSVNNAAAASPGAPVESDRALRIRQAVSTSNPAQSLPESLLGSVLGVIGVTDAIIHENVDSAIDYSGVLGHGVALVVRGGDSADVAAAIAARVPPGVSLIGNVHVGVTDANGFIQDIRYSVPTSVYIAVSISIKQLKGFNSKTIDTTRSNLVSYINALKIGDSVGVGDLYTPANSADGTYRVESLQLARKGNSLLAQDVAIAYNEIAVSIPTDIAISLV